MMAFCSSAALTEAWASDPREQPETPTNATASNAVAPATNLGTIN